MMSLKLENPEKGKKYLKSKKVRRSGIRRPIKHKPKRKKMGEGRVCLKWFLLINHEITKESIGQTYPGRTQCLFNKSQAEI